MITAFTSAVHAFRGVGRPDLRSPFVSGKFCSAAKPQPVSLSPPIVRVKITAKRERIDPSDEAFVTCPACGADEIVSASKLIRNATVAMRCSQCRNTWTAHVDDAITIMGTKLLAEGAASGEDGDDSNVMQKIGVKLYVSGLAPKVTKEILRNVMEQFGEVRDVKVIYDKVTGRSRGFGFVTIVGKSAASAAIDILSGDSSSVLGRRITVREAFD